MNHDFHSSHGGANNPCDGQGFMSYGNHLSQWSQCSVQDFIAQYTVNVNQWCMPGKLFILKSVSLYDLSWCLS